MKQETLLISAKELVQISEVFAKEYQSKRNMLVDKMNKKMLERPDIKTMVGELNLDMMKDNHANHARFLESLFFNYSADVLVDTVIWVFGAYRSRGFMSTYWSAQLNTWVDIYKEHLTEDCFKSIYPYYNWMLINIPNFTQLSCSKIETPPTSHS